MSTSHLFVLRFVSLEFVCAVKPWSSYAYQYCLVWKILCSWNHLPTSGFTLFLPSLSCTSLGLEGMGLIKTSYLGLSA